MFDLNRRELITLLGGAAAAWPLAARTQQAGGIGSIGLLWPGDAPPASPRMESFRQGLRARFRAERWLTAGVCSVYPRGDEGLDAGRKGGRYPGQVRLVSYKALVHHDSNLGL
jgi:hypothetical protein